MSKTITSLILYLTMMLNISSVYSIEKDINSKIKESILNTNKCKVNYIEQNFNLKQKLFKEIINKEISEEEKLKKLRKESNDIKANLVNYLSTIDNRNSTLQRAIELHGGEKTNNCVFFLSEALRRTNYYVPEYIANTKDLTNYLLDQGWHISYDYTKLSKGDICFNKIDEKIGISSHVYTFYSWDNKNSTVNVIDNQSPYIHTRSLFYNNNVSSDFWYFITKNPDIR